MPEALPPNQFTPVTASPGIREFFLRPKKDYSVSELATLWGCPAGLIKELFRGWDEYDLNDPETRITHKDAAEWGVGYAVLSSSVVEDALGDDFRVVRDAAWRTETVTLRLPAWLCEAIRNDDDRSLSPIRALENTLESILLDRYHASAPNAEWR